MAVIGGGLAGITAAIALAEAGAAVTLLEARPRLGGATCSFTRDGLVVDTGQHIFLGCCTAYRGLLGQLGMTAHAPVQDRFDVTVLAPGPRRGQLRRAALPGPLHMLPALARYPFLSLAERSGVSRPALAMRGVDPADPATDEQRFGDWLVAHGQSERARRALWDLFTVSALNVRRRRRFPVTGRHRGADRPARPQQRGRHRRPRASPGRAARRRGRRPAGQARRPGPPQRQSRRHRARRPVRRCSGPCPGPLTASASPAPSTPKPPVPPAPRTPRASSPARPNSSWTRWCWLCRTRPPPAWSRPAPCRTRPWRPGRA